MKANAKRGRPAKRKRALEYQPGEMPSPDKVSKEARVEGNDDEKGIFTYILPKPYTLNWKLPQIKFGGNWFGMEKKWISPVFRYPKIPTLNNRKVSK